MSNGSANHALFHPSSVTNVIANHSTSSWSHKETDLDRLTTIYLRLMLFICISVLIFVLSQPWIESHLIRWVFGEKLNYCNYTYVPATHHYRRPFKTYTWGHTFCFSSPVCFFVFTLFINWCSSQHTIVIQKAFPLFATRTLFASPICFINFSPNEIHLFIYFLIFMFTCISTLYPLAVRRRRYFPRSHSLLSCAQILLWHGTRNRPFCIIRYRKIYKQQTEKQNFLLWLLWQLCT